MERSRPTGVSAPGSGPSIPADPQHLVAGAGTLGWYHALVRICFTLVQIVRGTISPGTRPPVFDASARLAGIRDFFRRRFRATPAR
ncbi:MAG: hypothetical protein R2789_10290 [Microthrixaceae bacterium]